MFIRNDACFPVTYAEKRRAPRRRPARETIAHLRNADGFDMGTGLVWNLSTSGVSLLFDRPLEPGLPLQVELIGPGLPGPIRREIEIIHRSPLQTGDYFLGGHFTEALAEEELEALVVSV